MVVARVPETRIGVKVDRLPLPDEHRVNPPAWDPPTFLDEVECELISARGGVVRGVEHIKHFENWDRRDPDGARVMAERHGGTGTTVADWIASERDLIARCETDARDMEEVKDAWAEHEDYIASFIVDEATGFEGDGLARPSKRAEEAIRLLLRRHLRAEELEDLTEGLADCDEEKIFAVMDKLQADSDLWVKRHNAPERIALYPAVAFVEDECRELGISVDFEPVNVSRPAPVKVARAHGSRRPFRRFRGGVARGRAARRSPVRATGSRRGSSKASPRGGDPPDGGGDPERRRRRRLYRAVVPALLLFFVITGTGKAVTAMGDFETRGPEFRYPSELPFAPLPDDAIPPLHPSWQAEDLQRLIDDPRQFEAEQPDEHFNLIRGPHNWVADVIGAILNRAVDEYNPENGYLCDNFGPNLGEALTNVELRELLRAVEDGDHTRVDAFMEKVNSHSERSALNFGSDCFDHYRARRLANGEVRILMDQRGAQRMRHVSALKIQKTTRATSSAPMKAARRTNTRARASSRPAASRTRGSRRTTTSSGGGGSGGDDPPGGEPEPALGRLAEIAGGLDV